MSNEAITWALGQKVDRSSAKFVLVAMANIASATDMTCYPSIQYLSDATCQDRKTVVENLKRLRDSGHIIDTGARKGSTGQVPVYRLNDTENGTVKCNDTETGTVPETDSNSTVFPHKEARFSPLTDPKTGHGYLNTPKDTKGIPKKREQVAPVDLPDWLPMDAWKNWVTYRKGIKAPLTDHMTKLCIAKLSSLRDAGNDPVAVIDQSIMSGKWTGLFEIKSPQARASPIAGASRSHLGPAGQATAAAAQRLIEKMEAEHG